MKLQIIILVTFFVSSCQYKKTSKQNFENKRTQLEHNGKEIKDSSIPSAIPVISFLDSISKKDTLPVYQIQRNTLIDSIYYTGIFSDVLFLGDTTFKVRDNFYGAIIDYDDRKSCIYKFLLIFDSLGRQNTDVKIIYTDCDHDESSDFTSLRFQVLTDSTFETITSHIPANSENNANNKVKIDKWRVNSHGQFYLPSKQE